MHACGVIVEYNPFHNGHEYHLEQAREKSQADYIIAIMSGNFLQRGEPAIIDKFYRAESALKAGAHIVLELPFAYAVQSSHYFAMGAVRTLHEIGVSSICFGSEQGEIEQFKQYNKDEKQSQQYDLILKNYLAKGLSYPMAHDKATKSMFGNTTTVDLTKPNNILGQSYVQRVKKDDLPIDLLTVKRIDSNYHDETITGSIASATSIRKQLFKQKKLTNQIKHSLPESSIKALKDYESITTMWHGWEQYFPLLKYRVLTMTPQELALIHHVDEGLEHRILKTVKKATSFKHWMNLMKTKRYTWVRLQRMFVHILTNTTKDVIEKIHHEQTMPYIRILGFTAKGQTYLSNIKKQLNVPLITQVNDLKHPSLTLDEKASHTYYSVLPAKQQIILHRKDVQGPVIVNQSYD